MEGPGGGEALPVAHPVDLVEGRVVEVDRHEAVAQPPDPAGGVGLAEQDAPRRVDRHGRDMRSEEVPETGDRPAHGPSGTDGPDEDIDPSERGGELIRQHGVGAGVVGVGVLGGQEVAGMSCPQLRQSVEAGLLVAADRRRLGHDVDGGAEVPHPPPQARVDGGIADEHQRAAPEPALHGQRQPERARRRLDDDGARLEQPVVAGPVEDVPGRQQLHEAEGRSEQIRAETDDPGELQRPGDRRGNGGGGADHGANGRPGPRTEAGPTVRLR